MEKIELGNRLPASTGQRIGIYDIEAMKRKIVQLQLLAKQKEAEERAKR
jgi:hypothetical protein